MVITNTAVIPAADNAAPASETHADATTTPDAATVTNPRPDGPSGPVWDALTANPGASVAAIAAAAGVSKAAARRTLIELESGGHATRTPGGRDGGKRAPDAWHPTPAATATDTPDAEADPGDTDTGEAGEQNAVPVSDEPTPDATTGDTTTDPVLETAPETATETVDVNDAAERGEVASAEADGDEARDVEGLDAAAVAEARQALTALGEEIISAVDALIAGDRAAALTAAETIYAGSGKARRLVRTAANGRPRISSGRAKSNPGEMRAKVAAHLTAHPGKEFTPHEISKVIGHSAGAIANALYRLTELGEAVETCERPRRFTAATGIDSADEGASTAVPMAATA